MHQPQIDCEVGPRADELLNQASQLTENVTLELSKTQPDWLWILETIQLADQRVDEALEVIRSEQESMTHRRLRLASEKVEAETALQRLRNYLQIHPYLDMPVKDALQEVEGLFTRAQALEREALTQGETLLAQTLEQATAMFDQAEQKATLGFNRAEFEVQQALAKENKDDEASVEQVRTQTYLSAATRSYSRSSLKTDYSSRFSSSSYAKPSRPNSSRSGGSWGGGSRKSGGAGKSCS